MKYAIISDIHGDILALEEALKEIENKSVDKIICLGDIVGIGPFPDECVKRLKSLGDKLICVRGNHEDRFINGIPEFFHDEKRKMTEEEIGLENWIRSQVSEESAEYLKSLPQEIILKDGNTKIAVMHYPSFENGEYQRFVFCPRKEEALEFFSRYDAKVMLFGHTHIAFAHNLDEKYIFNPGSLGLPGFRTYGTYGLLEISDKKVKYEEHYFNYDYQKVLDDMTRLDYPRQRVMKDIFFGERD